MWQSLVFKVLAEWTISWDKLSRLLSDNGSSVVRAFVEATESIVWTDLESAREFPVAAETVGIAEAETSQFSNWPLFNGQLEESFEEEKDVNENDEEISEFEQQEESHAAAFGRKVRITVEI